MLDIFDQARILKETKENLRKRDIEERKERISRIAQ
jgi:hypothetical protein